MTATQNGSPLLLSAVGRVLGLGQDEQRALADGKIPGWLWLTVGLVGGTLVGIQIYKRWPERVPDVLVGER